VNSPTDFNPVLPKNTGGTPRVTNVPMALLLLFCLFAFFLILTPILTVLIGKICHKPDAVLRIAMMLQDILVFILPALVTALVSTRLPARLLAVDTPPPGIPLVLALCGLIVSVPAMNSVIAWNEGVHLPESLSSVENTLRELENNAKAVTDSLMAGASVPSLLVSILIIGVFAGFSEELFFRGAFQRIAGANGMNHHAVIWITAFVFSLFHFQFFGFVPRMLLGAYFGYLLFWTRSLWVPVIVHIFNNSMVVYTTWKEAGDPGILSDLDKLGTSDPDAGTNLLVVSVSLVLTVIILRAIYKMSQRNRGGVSE